MSQVYVQLYRDLATAVMAAMFAISCSMQSSAQLDIDVFWFAQVLANVEQTGLHCFWYLCCSRFRLLQTQKQ
jgi:hypothetical protein